MAQDEKDSSIENVQDNLENPNFGSDFSYLYKNTGKGTSLSQQERREFLLKEQKEKRHNVVDSHRNFTELFLGDDNGEALETSEDMEVEVHNRRKKHDVQFRLMRSEWFCEVPEDLEENWLVKLAPEGIRVLVIAKRCNTIAVNEKGKVLNLKTYLPGGGFDQSGLTVLDCIYNKLTKTVFVLDCLFWNTMSMLDSETTFRFYWIKNKFNENCMLSETNKPHKIHLLDFFPAQKPLIQDKIFEVLTVSNHQILHEGVVFYHKELHYTFEETPLLGWLFTYMLPEKLGIDIPPENTERMPKGYECLEKYLELKRKKAEDRRRYRQKRLEKQNMDTS